ncbi:NADH pyrophosphatase [Nonomuraea coxensis DSM 45129]|uniref:NADH pyrophosphatase n=1 Tax=Nonomuraea coxensis DSM 45129 TaxID=1122611 RepID=A0ABX8TVI4_9ACTN|nr:NUDIX domain-containing protein [Nonomuraea coxensis]QYC38949.1 NADH pyrophosphatase [Nonomuraea coxensis DSM 45129]
MTRLLARVWRMLGGRLRWRLVWLTHATFMVGVTGLVRDGEGRLLVLRHRLWPESRPWGFPTGYARRGETFEETVRREVREETGLDVRVGRLLRVRSGYALRAEVAYEAVLTGGTLRLDPLEILEARWCDPGDLPEGLQPAHTELLAENPSGSSGG